MAQPQSKAKATGRKRGDDVLQGGSTGRSLAQENGGKAAWQLVFLTAVRTETACQNKQAHSLDA
jgi:hypothetical protein